MSRIDTIFADLRARDRRALMPFICAGRPSLTRLPELLPRLESAGASIVEIGIPFSDPIADGPVIAAAMHRALLDGVTPKNVFSAVAAARSSTSLGLVAMVTMSIVHRLGAAAFCRQAAASGFDGLIIPDLSLDEGPSVRVEADRAGLSFSLLVAPATAPDRAERIVKLCTGFVYLLARTGVTGERDEAPHIIEPVERLRQITDLPIACGFGVSTAGQVNAVVEHADAAIVGSALVRRVETSIENGDDPVEIAASFVRSLALGLA